MINELRYPVLPGLICTQLNIFCVVNIFKKCVLQFKGVRPPPWAMMGEVVKPAPKSSLDRWGGVNTISLIGAGV